MTLADNWQIRLIQLLAVPGLLLAYFLYLFHEGVLVGVCEANSFWDCGQVSGPDAPYASIGPVSVALLGLVGYAAIFLAAWLQDWVALVDAYMPELMLGLTGTALLFSLGLTALEAFVIGAYCEYCVASAVIVLLMFILSISYLRRSAAGDG